MRDVKSWLLLASFSLLVMVGCSSEPPEETSPPVTDTPGNTASPIEETTPPDGPTPTPPDGPTPTPPDGPTPTPPDGPTPTPPDVTPTPPRLDNDGDGYTAALDCDDTDRDVYPGAPEVCDGIDNDCDAQKDEGLATVWYADGDQDGYGNTSVSTQSCSHPSGYVAVSGDCDDTRPDVSPGDPETCNGRDDDCDGGVDEGSTYYYDGDKDGYGVTSNSVSSCSQPVGYVLLSGDCNDVNASINPGATEQCNGVDDDCDASIDDGARQTFYLDADGDGYGTDSSTISACPKPVGYAVLGGDCNDNDPSMKPNGTESCDLKDNDCDAAVDEGVTNTYYQDADGDGFGNAAASTQACSKPNGYVLIAGDCNDTTSAVKPTASEVCDGLDNDCDSAVDEGLTSTFYQDSDGDGYGNPSVSVTACSKPTGYVTNSTDCNDSNASVRPGATEVCDGLDNDCDAAVDEGLSATYYQDADGDGYGNPSVSVASCTKPTGYVTNNADCNDTSAAIKPGATETCDSLDNDCDGLVDETSTRYYRDQDGDGYGVVEAGGYYCTKPSGYVTSTGDCNDGDATIKPFATELCDTKDNDCDFVVDEGFNTLYYRDADGDTYGLESDTRTSCTAVTGYSLNRGDCNDADGKVYPGAGDSSGGVDADCGGTTGTDPHVGFSGASAFNIAAALASAVNGQTIWVANGTYSEWNISFAGKKVSLRSVRIGGATVDASSQGRHFLFNNYETSQTVLDGFKLIGGYVSATFQTYAVGGSIYISGASPTLRNLTLDGNECYEEDGGAIYASSSSAVIENLICQNNLGVSGGCFFGTYFSGVLKNSVFLSNTAYSNSSSNAFGGGITLEYSDSFTLSNISAKYNVAKTGGGAIDLFRSGGSIDGMRMVENTAAYGGGAHVYDSSTIMSNLLVRENVASTSGGGGLNLANSSTASVGRALVVGNRAATYGGGINVYQANPSGLAYLRVQANSAGLEGGGIGFNGAQAYLYTAAVVNNSAPTGAGLNVYGTSSSVAVSHSISAYNSGYNLQNSTTLPGSVAASYSAFYSVNGLNNTNVTLGAGCLTQEPGFLSYLNGSPLDLHLAKTSPLIGKGSGSLDPDGTTTDIGAYGGDQAGQYNLDSDGRPDYFWPGTINQPPSGFSSSSYDCNDQNAAQSSGC
ncbi:MAG: MopE-related protein [Myxococcota bacterium]